MKNSSPYFFQNVLGQTAVHFRTILRTSNLCFSELNRSIDHRNTQVPADKPNIKCKKTMRNAQATIKPTTEATILRHFISNKQLEIFRQVS